MTVIDERDDTCLPLPGPPSGRSTFSMHYKYACQIPIQTHSSSHTCLVVHVVLSMQGGRFVSDAYWELH